MAATISAVLMYCIMGAAQCPPAMQQAFSQCQAKSLAGEKVGFIEDCMAQNLKRR